MTVVRALGNPSPGVYWTTVRYGYASLPPLIASPPNTLTNTPPPSCTHTKVDFLPVCPISSGDGKTIAGIFYDILTANNDFFAPPPLVNSFVGTTIYTSFTPLIPSAKKLMRFELPNEKADAPHFAFIAIPESIRNQHRN